MSRPRRLGLAIALALAAAGAIVLALRWAQRAPAQGAVASPEAGQAGAATARAPGPAPGLVAIEAPEPAAEPATSDEREALIAHLRARYGANIRSPHVQMKMLEELLRYAQKRSPNGWQALALELLAAAFPELHEELAQRLQQRLDYEAWANENSARLRGDESGERSAALWEARSRIFGQDAAEQIWAAEIRNQSVADALAAIDADEGGSVADKLAMYRQTLEDVYQDELGEHLQRHRHALMSRFIGLDSVQGALTEMSAAERETSLREIREGMGLEQDALERWSALDRERDARWERGRRYMEERAALVGARSGDELAQALDALRARYFGAEAEIVAQEEAAGFFRYDRPRRWGRE